MAPQRREWLRLLTNSIVLLIAIFAELGTIAGSSVTLIDGDYREVLTQAIICAAVALVSYGILIVRGPRRWRIAGLLLAMSVAPFVSDFFRRAPYVFRQK